MSGAFGGSRSNLGVSYGPGYGGTSQVDIFDPTVQKRGGAGFHVQSIGTMAFPSFLMFAFLDISFATLAGTWFPVALVGACVCIAFAGLFYSLATPKKAYYMYAGVLCFIATFSGITSGLTIQARFFSPYWNYHHRPIYSDVLATDPAAARLDAGVVNFADNAVVDIMRTGNYLSPRGKKFCAAPILDESQQSVAEFWAVGMGCCEGHVNFYCDSAQDLSAKSGAVVFRTDSYLVRDPWYHYMEAVKQAASRNQLKIPDAPLLVRWVKDPATVTEGLWAEGTIHVLVGITVYGIASFLVAAALHFATAKFEN